MIIDCNSLGFSCFGESRSMGINRVVVLGLRMLKMLMRNHLKISGTLCRMQAHVGAFTKRLSSLLKYVTNTIWLGMGSLQIFQDIYIYNVYIYIQLIHTLLGVERIWDITPNGYVELLNNGNRTIEQAHLKYLGLRWQRLSVELHRMSFYPKITFTQIV